MAPPDGGTGKIVTAIMAMVMSATVLNMQLMQQRSSIFQNIINSYKSHSEHSLYIMDTFAEKHGWKGHKRKKYYQTRAERGITDSIKRPRLEVNPSWTFAYWDDKEDKHFKNLTRLEKSEFESILAKRVPIKNALGITTHRSVFRCLVDPYNVPTKGARQFTDHRNTFRKVQKKRLSPQDMLMVFLKVFSHRSGDWKNIGLDCGLSASTVRLTFYHVQDILHLALVQGPDRTVNWNFTAWPLRARSHLFFLQVRWPEARVELPDGQLDQFCRAAMADKLISLKGCIGFMDGTRVRIRRPKAGQGINYSGKTKMHCKNHQVIIDLYGR
jgi:hypothetical protein